MPLGILVYILMFGMASHILQQIKLFELKIAFPLYMLLINTMLWRALAKINWKNKRTVHVIIALGSLNKCLCIKISSKFIIFFVIYDC